MKNSGYHMDSLYNSFINSLIGNWWYTEMPNAIEIKVTMGVYPDFGDYTTGRKF